MHYKTSFSARLLFCGLLLSLETIVHVCYVTSCNTHKFQLFVCVTSDLVRSVYIYKKTIYKRAKQDKVVA